MRVCIMTTSFPGFPGHVQSPFILELCRALVKEGCTVDVIAPMYKESVKSEEVIDGVRVHRFSYFIRRFQTLTEAGGIPSQLKKSVLGWVQGFLFLVAMYMKAGKYVRQADVMHAQWLLPGLVGGILKMRYKKSLIITERGAALNTALEKWWMRPILLWTLRQADVLCANNQSQASMIEKLNFTCKFVPNGINVENFHPRKQSEVRKKLGLDVKKTFILYSGWLIPRKSVDTLLYAVQEVREKKKQDVEVLIVGQGVLEPDLKKLAQELKIEKYVHFVGAVAPEKVGLWYNAADMFVLPSKSEGRPNVILEAMASGIPVVASNIPGNDEFVQHGKNGFLFSVGSAQELATYVNELLQKREKSAKFVKGALPLTEKLSWKQCAKNYFAIYSKV